MGNPLNMAGLSGEKARATALSVFSTVWSSGATESCSHNEVCSLYSLWQVSCYLKECNVSWLKKAPIKSAYVWFHCWLCVTLDKYTKTQTHTNDVQHCQSESMFIYLYIYIIFMHRREQLL